MAKRPKASIFEKQQLQASQLFTVADRRFDDALHLCRSKENARANGAMYLAGFVIECCLKGQLLRAYGWLRSGASPHGRSKDDQYLWALCYRRHALDEILARLPRVQDRLRARDQLGGPSLVTTLREVCSTWTIFARYSSYSANIREAEQFVESVRELKRWLSA
jgi:hypothetical protein